MPSRLSALSALPVAATRLDGSPVEVTDDAPVLVLPGGPCRGAEYLGSLAGLGEEHPLVVMHPRGTPRSGGLSRGWWTDAEDVIALADALGMSRVRLIAHSAGTRLALAVATRFPERVASMALITPPATWLSGTPYDGEELSADRDDPAVASAIAALAEATAGTEVAFRAQFLRQAPASYAHWSSAEREHAEVGAMSLASAAAWFADIPADVADRVRHALRVPALVVAGDRDLLTGFRPVADYAAVLGAELRTIEDCGHYPWVEQPESFREIMSEWLGAQN